MISLASQCCFCAGAIDDLGHRVRITIAGMAAGTAGQDLFSHVSCLADRFAPILATGTPFDAEAFASDGAPGTLE